MYNILLLYIDTGKNNKLTRASFLGGVRCIKSKKKLEGNKIKT